MDCGGKHSATPLSPAPDAWKLASPLPARKRRRHCRSAGAVQNCPTQTAFGRTAGSWPGSAMSRLPFSASRRKPFPKLNGATGAQIVPMPGRGSARSAVPDQPASKFIPTFSRPTTPCQACLVLGRFWIKAGVSTTMDAPPMVMDGPSMVMDMTYFGMTMTDLTIF